MDLTAASALSVAGHLVIAASLIALVRFAGGGADDPLRPPPAPVATETADMEVEVATVGDPTLLRAEKETPVDPPDVAPRGGNDPRPDDGAHGKGGDDRVKERALNMADRDDSASLDRSVLSRVDRSQLPRIKAHTARASYEDWRATRKPMELTFFSVGPGETTFERRKLADVDPAHGAPSSARRDSPGMYLGHEALQDGDGDVLRKPVGTDRVGGPTSSPGVGVRASRERLGAESERAKVADTRPLVDQSDPSVFASDKDHPGDTADSEQEVASRAVSIVHASTAGGQPGDGTGGQRGPGYPGSGGDHGAGSISAPMGANGTGAPDPRDAARVGYIRALQSKIRFPEFPKKAALDLKQGTATVTFTLDANGNVTSATVTRSSGIPEFDDNARREVLRGGPYGKLPDLLMPGLTVRMPFTAKNPSIRPSDPGDGIAER